MSVIEAIGIVFRAVVSDQLSDKIKRKIGIFAAKNANGACNIKFKIKGRGRCDLKIFDFHSFSP